MKIIHKYETLIRFYCTPGNLSIADCKSLLWLC